MSLKTNELEMTPVDLAKFIRHGNELVAEASEFGSLREGRWWLQRIYNDACDVGIAIKSHKSDRVVRFSLSKEVVHDGDLQCWEFLPLDKDHSIQKVVIFND